MHKEENKMKIEKVLVIGSGTMGHGIAQIALMAGNKVTLVDIKDDILAKAKAKIQAGMDKLEKKGKLKGQTSEGIMQNLTISTDLAESVKDIDLVVEAAIENLDIKKKLFATCHENAPEHCIIASNTSSMSITKMAEATGRPDKVCGIHFFNPAPMMRLVEIIKHDGVSDDTIKAAKKWAASLPCLRGRRYIPVSLKDRPGFIANRVTCPVSIYTAWGVDQAKAQNKSFEELDTDLFNPMAPMSQFVLLDYTGLDVVVHAKAYYAKTLHPDFAKGDIINEMVKQGTLGAKTGQGFFTWKDGKQPMLDRSKSAGILDMEMVGAIQANESCRLLEEGVVKDWETIDATVLAGYNMEGSMKYLVEKNRERWVKMLDDFAKESGLSYLAPCDLMRSGKYREMRKL